ncbi:Uncharacterised protein [Campylobacter hyointestinalis subsp. hyointestinalis]|uniref:Uncharacterized protein n=1 Tax=Campylobacter hyointestinalis subsp. hyointestinalis TaxID=91352 RepID=A0A0S4SVY0_CAMHY|nr:hypothetical protein [Campylobacter hyointestinalis]CUU89879.1 Uncharacterised protein [Campylobacter hyointestinalis subsp. hyointestinalis]
MFVNKRIQLEEKVYAFLCDKVKELDDSEKSTTQVGDIVKECVETSIKVSNIPENIIKALNLIFSNAQMVNLDKDKISQELSQYLKDYYKNMIDEII